MVPGETVSFVFPQISGKFWFWKSEKFKQSLSYICTAFYHSRSLVQNSDISILFSLLNTELAYNTEAVEMFSPSIINPSGICLF